MKKFFISFLIVLSTFVQATAQEQSLQETARSFMRSGDFDNAILVLTKALDADKNNLDLQKDLALSFYYKRDYAKALDVVKMMFDNNPDINAYQIGGNVYKALEEVKEAEKMYKRALKQYPKSGALYSEFGELLWARKDYDAIKYWESGIKEDPSFSGNYYNAALFYYYTKDKVWSLVYGEIFVNMESLTERATAMKSLLLDAYKEKLFADADMLKNQDDLKSDFGKAFLQTMGKQSSLVNRGISTEILTAIRTRFILDWYKTYAAKYPFKLFDYQQQLIREGMFEAYNQWLFGTVENLPAYDSWTKTHSDLHAKFNSFQKNRIFKIPPGQYYQNL